MMARDWKMVIETAEKSLTLQGPPSYSYANLGMAHASLGNSKKAMEYLDKIEELAKQMPVPSLDRGSILNYLDDTATPKAFALEPGLIVAPTEACIFGVAGASVFNSTCEPSVKSVL